MDILDKLNIAAQKCNLCPLCNNRNKVVFGEGNKNAKLMFIGEGPGADEDATGRPFVGKAGQLLTKILSCVNIDRNEVYIANIVKCRPPQNRIPYDEEAEMCINYLRKQVAIIKPKIIICLGATAAKYIIDRNIKITKDRGKWIEKGKFLMMATYHPSALLRDPSKKADAWKDFQSIKEKYDSV